MLAIAAHQSTMMPTDPTPSRASSLPQFFPNRQAIRDHQRSPVGASLLAIAAHQPTMMPTDPTPSRASPLPQFFSESPKPSATTKNPLCGSLLAIADYQPTMMPTDPTPSRAGSLPQFFPSRPSHPRPPKIPCGSGLARESGLSVNHDAESDAAFASNPAPTVLTPAGVDRWDSAAPGLGAFQLGGQGQQGAFLAEATGKMRPHRQAIGAPGQWH